MPKLAAIGELLIDFSPAGTSVNGNTLFERNPGGAPANVAVQAPVWVWKVRFWAKSVKTISAAF